MEDERELAISELAKHFDYDTKATQSFYDAHASSIPDGEDHASFLLDKIQDWQSGKSSGSAARDSSAAPQSGSALMTDIDHLTNEIEQLQLSIRETSYAIAQSRGGQDGDADDIEYDTAATEGIGSALKKGAGWIKRKVTGKKKSSSSSKKGDAAENEVDDAETNRAIDTLKKNIQRLQSKSRSTGFDEYTVDNDTAEISSAYWKRSEADDSGGEDATASQARADWHMLQNKKKGMKPRSEDYDSTSTGAAQIPRAGPYDASSMGDVDDEALVAEVNRILKNKVRPMARSSDYDGQAAPGEFDTEAQEKRFLIFGKSDRVLDLHVMEIGSNSADSSGTSFLSKTVEQIAPSIAGSLELWDRRMTPDGNFTERHDFVTDFIEAERKDLMVPGFKSPVWSIAGEFTIRGGSISTSSGSLLNSNKMKLRTNRVTIYQIILKPEKKTPGLTSKTMMLMHWPIQSGYPITNSSGKFVKEIVVSISDVSSTATGGVITEFPIEKGTLKMRVSEDAKMRLSDDPSPNVLIDAYVDKKAKRTVAVLLPYSNNKIDHLAFFWEA